MEGILFVLQEIAKPLSAELLLVAVIAGILFGAFYNYKVGIPRNLVYHKFTAGVWFITLIYIFRALTAAIAGAVVTSPLGWIGIGLLWGVFCLFIWIGQSIREKEIEDDKEKVGK